MEIPKVKKKLQQTLEQMEQLQNNPDKVNIDHVNQLIADIDEFGHGLEAVFPLTSYKFSGLETETLGVAERLLNRKGDWEKAGALQASELAPALFNRLQGLRDTLNGLSEQNKKGLKVEGIDPQEGLRGE